MKKAIPFSVVLLIVSCIAIRGIDSSTSTPPTTLAVTQVPTVNAVETHPLSSSPEANPTENSNVRASVLMFQEAISYVSNEVPTFGGRWRLDLIVTGLDGEPRTLPRDTFTLNGRRFDRIGQFAVSPDGSKVAFVGGFGDEVGSLFVVDMMADSVNRVPFGEGQSYPQGYPGMGVPSWAPDNRTLAFVAYEKQGDRYPMKTFMWRVGDSVLTQVKTWDEKPGLPGHRYEIDFSPTWSPDGRWLALLHYSGDVPPQHNTNMGKLIVVNPHDQIREVISHNALIMADRSTPDAVNRPAWSPSGRWIAFASGRIPLIAIVDVHSGEERWLTGRNEPENYPIWAPDGLSIVFTSHPLHTEYVSPHNEQNEIYRVSVDGSGVVNLTQDAAADDYWPVMSSDGNYLAFISTRGGVSPGYRLYVMTMDTLVPHQVSDSFVLTPPVWILQAK